MDPTILIGLFVGMMLIGGFVKAALNAKAARLDREAQLMLATPKIDPARIIAAPAEATPTNVTVIVTDVTHWTKITNASVAGQTFPDGTVLAKTVNGIDEQTGKAVAVRLNRDTKITSADGYQSFDRCCVGLMRLAGMEAPVRMPRTIDYDSNGKIYRPTTKITAEVIISYTEGVANHTTRRISVTGFEPIGHKGHTDDVRLHAWCWSARNYRSFNLSRIKSLMLVGTAQQTDKIKWAWQTGGMRFPPSDALRAS